MPRQLIGGALCTPTDVKDALANTDISTARDDQLIQYINLFSKMAEGGVHCNRFLEYKARTEYFDGIILRYQGDSWSRCRLFVKGPPIDSTVTFTLYDDSNRLWTDGTASTVDTRLTLWDDYHLDFDSGIISFYGNTFGADVHNLKFVYTGGLVAGVSTLTPRVPEDLRAACAMQCAFWYKNAHDPGAIQISSVGGGQVTTFTPTEILPLVKKVLQQYRRFEM